MSNGSRIYVALFLAFAAALLFFSCGERFRGEESVDEAETALP